MQFCTIISPDYLPFAQCLHANLRQWDASVELHVLVTGQRPAEDLKGMHFYEASQLHSTYTDDLLDQYAGMNDNLRWSLKPVFILFLLQRYEKIMYIDADLYFFQDPSFLFKLLDRYSIVLTPHDAPSDPFEQEEKFRMNFLAGLYNAGCVPVDRQATPSLHWWAKACLYKTAIDTANGFYVDQRYLDLIPVLDEKAGIVHHKGCNVGSWNMESRARVVQSNGEVLINGTDPIVFIHFNHETMRHILNGDDAALLPYFRRYEAAFAQTGHTLSAYIKNIPDWEKKSLFQTVKRSLSLRSRTRRWLYQLAKKL